MVSSSNHDHFFVKATSSITDLLPEASDSLFTRVLGTASVLHDFDVIVAIVVLTHSQSNSPASTLSFSLPFSTRASAAGAPPAAAAWASTTHSCTDSFL